MDVQKTDVCCVATQDLRFLFLVSTPDRAPLITKCLQPAVQNRRPDAQVLGEGRFGAHSFETTIRSKPKLHRHLSRETLRAVLILAACPWTDIPGWSATVGTHRTDALTVIFNLNETIVGSVSSLFADNRALSGELGSFPDEFLSYQSDEGLDDVSFALDAPEPAPDTGSGVRRER